MPRTTPAPPLPLESPRRGRPRESDEAVLRYIASHRQLTIHQIVYRFANLAGLHPRHAYRVATRLERERLITTDPLNPRLGRASRLVARLTPAGWRRAGYSAIPRDGWVSDLTEERLYRLQYAEMRLVREAEGWLIVAPDDAVAAIRDWALTALRPRVLNAYDRQLRDRFERLDLAIRYPCELLYRRNRSEIRIVLAGRIGASITTVLAKLPLHTLMLMGSLPHFLGRPTFELVAPSAEHLAQVQTAVKRWARPRRRRHLLQYQEEWVAPFTERRNPLRDPNFDRPAAVSPDAWATRHVVDTYATNGVPDPRTLRGTAADGPHYDNTRWPRACT